jgi:hypothetical protein
LKPVLRSAHTGLAGQACIRPEFHERFPTN